MGHNVLGVDPLTYITSRNFLASRRAAQEAINSTPGADESGLLWLRVVTRQRGWGNLYNRSE